MTKFNPGEKVICTCPGGQHGLYLGHQYTVVGYQSYDAPSPLVILKGIGPAYYEYRFRLAPIPMEDTRNYLELIHAANC